MGNENMQEYHQNTMNRIQKLQSLETYLWGNMNKLKNDGDVNGAAAEEITSKLTDLKEMRISLLTQLNNMYIQEQNQLAISRSNLVNHQTTGDVLDNSISNIKKQINALKDEKNNKIRMLKLSEYEYLRSKSHKNILKVLSYCLLVILVAIFLSGYSWFPNMLTTLIIIITVAFIILHLGKYMIYNFTRSNLYWHKFQQGDNSQFMNSSINTNTGSSRGFLSSLFSSSCDNALQSIGNAYDKAVRANVNVNQEVPEE
jgi:hypothetical protein